MQNPLSAHELTLAKVFSDDFVFHIPDFQRPYSWGVQQGRELLDDLSDAVDSRSGPVDPMDPYFMGSIVLVKTPAQPRAEIVDGQQRLTTLTVLLSAIRATLENTKARDGITKLIYEQDDIIAGTEARYRLSLRPKDRDFFRTYIQHEDGIERLASLHDTLPDPQARLRENARLFMQALGQRSQDALVRLAHYIATKCYLVVVATQDLGAAFRIFGVLNSRGLDLTATDILKSHVLSKIDESERGHYTKVWEDLEDDLGRDTFNDLFSHIRMVYRRSKPQGTLLKEFEEHVPLVPAAHFMDTVLGPMAKAFREILDGQYSSTQNADAVNACLVQMGRIEFNDWVPPALLFFSRQRNVPADVLQFFTDLERLAYSMLVRRTGVNDRIARFSDLTRAIDQGADLHADASPLQLSPRERQDTYTALAGPLYDTHSARALGILLLRLDGLLSGGGAVYERDRITVEHVLPQTPKADSDWAAWIPDEKDRQLWVHRLGNLALLTKRKNSAASNFDFDRKKRAYFTTDGVSPFAITTQVLQHQAWTLPVLEGRQTDLLGVLAKHWRLTDGEQRSGSLSAGCEARPQ